MDLEAQWNSAASVLVAMITTYGLRVVGAIVILVAGWMAARAVHTAIVRLCERTSRLDRTITIFLANGARYAVLVFTFVAVLTTFGIATTSFVAVLGAISIAIGLALQGTLSNLAAGIMLVVFRVFRIGDRIEAGGVVGVTRLINLFYTEIGTDENVRVVIPNGKLWGEVLRIHASEGTRRLELRYPRPANDDIGAAIARLKELIQRDRRIFKVDSVGVEALNDSGYVLMAQVWADREQSTEVQFDLNRAVKEEFERRAPVPVERRAG
jgi:small conductance mechanosensitive channel